MYHYWHAITAWDPITGELPKCQTEGFAEIVRRARKILANRTAKEICSLQHQLDEALEIATSSMLKFEPGQEIDFVTLQQCMLQVHEDNYFDPKALTGKFNWAECYATLALGVTAKIANADPKSDWTADYFELDNETIEIEYEKFAINQLNEAVTIIHIAYALYKISKQGRENIKGIKENKRGR
jgi:hypothetical protein